MPSEAGNIRLIYEGESLKWCVSNLFS